MVGLNQNSKTTNDVARDAVAWVDDLISSAVARNASDLHLEPTADGYEVRLRIDGLLEVVSRNDAATGRSMVTRLMVMAQLLTYRLDLPQEGRARFQSGDAIAPIELRVAVIPTTHGLRAAVRMPAELIQPKRLDDIGLPESAMNGLRRFAESASGMLVVTGPAGSGKTTSIYALLQYLVERSPGLSIVALEDPVERDLPGVTQIEVSPFGQLTYERALRSILRQDPQVLMLGEIRDAETATLAIQAALSGHRLICTLHAATPGGAVARLLEMGLEPYRITSALHGVLAQRLVRKLKSMDSLEPHYRGRVPVAEYVAINAATRRAILAGADAGEIQKVAAQSEDYRSLHDCAAAMMAQGLTDEAEVIRVLGPASRASS
ncbi:MAG TPA: ATPase, T2SS/T4P/T4SS family [Tepidisphaeraceae bacterium]|jgi:type II secretory ATPase GspE/PulE/Tfp pilus assembly ATPase PilB-like protein|nr:ATPase, T2SS/T4P/T4SS family [Tepidisphaeraceae bacterium]